MASADEPPTVAEVDEARAPVLGTWRRWYVLVFATLVVLVVAFAALSQHYR
jgi:hypothetical protein